MATSSNTVYPLPTRNSGSASTVGRQLSRKREAAKRLPPIGRRIAFHDDDGGNNSDFSSDSTQEESVDAKRHRSFVSLCRHGSTHCALDDFSSDERTSSSRDSSKSRSYCQDVNNEIICGYQIVGAGRPFSAFHLVKKIVKTCQVIDNDQFKKVLDVQKRLNEAEKYWLHYDINELREFVLPSDTEFCLDHRGRRFMFSSWQYGTLNTRVQSGKNCSERDVKPLFCQIARGIAFCHSCGLILRDVKMQKFVFTDANMSRLRLRDVFDIAVCDDVTDDHLDDRHRCPAYVAPEILKDIPAYAGRPADIWALGVLLYVLLFSSYPFNDSTPQKLFCRILKAKFWIPPDAGISVTARALIHSMLRKEPDQRPTAEEIISIPWNVDEESKITYYTALHERLSRPVEYSSLINGTEVASVINLVNPALELTRQFTSSDVVQDDAGDQVVPNVSSLTLSVHQILQNARKGS